MAKTKELFFYRPTARNYLPSVALPDIEIFICAKLIGVWLEEDLGMKEHVSPLDAVSRYTGTAHSTDGAC